MDQYCESILWFSNEHQSYSLMNSLFCISSQLYFNPLTEGRNNKEIKTSPVRIPWHQIWSQMLCRVFAPPLHSQCCTLQTWWKNTGCDRYNNFEGLTSIWKQEKVCHRLCIALIVFIVPLVTLDCPLHTEHNGGDLWPTLTWSWGPDRASCCSLFHLVAWKSIWEGSAAWACRGCSPIWSGCRWRLPVVKSGTTKAQNLQRKIQNWFFTSVHVSEFRVFIVYCACVIRFIFPTY